MISKEALFFGDPAAQIDSIAGSILKQVRDILRRRGLVLGLSGGIDSSVCAALCARALGRERVLALLLPERDASRDSLRLGKVVAERLEIPYITEDITPILVSAGCYRRQHQVIQEIFPDFHGDWKFKLSLPVVTEKSRLPITNIIVQSPDGTKRSERLSADAYLQLVAATNFKQRVRKMIEYYHADRLHYAVCGTPNRLEYDQGFFVKNGDGSADVKPIAHLYKTQVFQLAEALGIPDEIVNQVPTTDTFSLSQTQEEFYFGVPYQQMDLSLFAVNHKIPAREVAAVVDLTEEQVARVFQDIQSKRRATRYLHTRPLLVESVAEIEQERGE